MSGVVHGRAVRKWSSFNQRHYWALQVPGDHLLTGVVLSPSDSDREANIRASVAELNKNRAVLGLPVLNVQH